MRSIICTTNEQVLKMFHIFRIKEPANSVYLYSLTCFVSLLNLLSPEC